MRLFFLLQLSLSKERRRQQTLRHLIPFKRLCLHHFFICTRCIAPYWNWTSLVNILGRDKQVKTTSRYVNRISSLSDAITSLRMWRNTDTMLALLSTTQWRPVSLQNRVKWLSERFAVSLDPIALHFFIIYLSAFSGFTEMYFESLSYIQHTCSPFSIRKISWRQKQIWKLQKKGIFLFDKMRPDLSK